VTGVQTCALPIYLASRVRYLERQLEEKGSESGSASEDELRTKLAKVEAEAGDAARLRARISELERSLDRAKSDDDGAAKNEGEYALEWRNRYLSSRVSVGSAPWRKVTPADALLRGALKIRALKTRVFEKN